MRLRRWELASLLLLVLWLAVNCTFTYWTTRPQELPSLGFDDEDAGEEAVAETMGPEPYELIPRLGIQFDEVTQRFGLTLLRLSDPRYPEKPKNLTYDERGLTSNTCVCIDGKTHDYGREADAVHWAQWNGKPFKEVRSSSGRKWTSAMNYERERVRVTQSVELVVGEQTRLYDTALVKYIVQNLDTRAHAVGLRTMIDTCIGSNDGGPFFIPPSEDAPAHLVDTVEAFEGCRVPSFLRVLESDDFNDNRITVAEMSLHLGSEPMAKLVLCRWPVASEASWDWPFRAMNDPPGSSKDACVVLYWAKSRMEPAGKRVLAYTYGLGRIGIVAHWCILCRPGK